MQGSWQFGNGSNLEPVLNTQPCWLADQCRTSFTAQLHVYNYKNIIKVELADISSTKQVCKLMNRICSCKNSTEHHCVLHLRHGMGRRTEKHMSSLTPKSQPTSTLPAHSLLHLYYHLHQMYKNQSPKHQKVASKGNKMCTCQKCLPASAKSHHATS